MSKQKQKEKVEFNPAEGTYYERVFSPDSIKVRLLNSAPEKVPIDQAAPKKVKRNWSWNSLLRIKTDISLS